MRVTRLLLRSPSPLLRRLSTQGSSLRSPATTHETIKGRVRFYRAVGVQPAAAGGFQVTLDGRPLPSPARQQLVFPSEALAWAVAAEWDNQSSVFGIEPSFMPLMALSSTAVDQIAPDPTRTIRALLPYLHTDTSCFRAPEEDFELRQRQDEAFQPLRDWVREAHGVELDVSDSVVARPRHSYDAEERVAGLLQAMDEYELAALQCATTNCKSIVMGLALVQERLTPEEAQEACRIEEDYQMEQWGLVEGGHDVDQAASLASLASASSFLKLRDLGRMVW